MSVQHSLKNIINDLVSDLENKMSQPLSNSCKDILRKVLEDALQGDESQGDESNMPAMSAAALQFLCQSKVFAENINPKGLRLNNFRIEQELDLDSAKIQFPLVLKGCTFEGNIILRDAQTRFLSFQASTCKHIDASRINVEGSLWLNRGFTATKGIELNGAHIAGNLSFSESEIHPIDDAKSSYYGKAVILDQATIDGNLLLWAANQENGFMSTGEFSLVGAKIGGAFICREARFNTSKLPQIGSYLDDVPHPFDEVPHSLDATLAVIKGVFDMRRVEAKGQMILMNMEIHGDLKCDGGDFSHNQCKPNLAANGDQYKHAISLDRSVIKGTVFMRDGFKATGQVRLFGVTIMNDLDCSGGKFSLSEHAEQSEPYTLFIVRSTIHGDVSLGNSQTGTSDRFETDGLISLGNVEIHSALDVDGTSFINTVNTKEKIGIEILGCHIDRYVNWHNVRVTEKTIFDLAGTTVDTLKHDLCNYETKIRLRLNRFKYDKLDLDRKPSSPPLKWLDLWENPLLGNYQQLATVLLRQGEKKEAENVLIRMEETKYKNWSDKNQYFAYPIDFFSAAYKFTLGYGCKPWRAILAAVVLIFLGGVVYQNAYKEGAFVPIQVSDHDERQSIYKNITNPDEADKKLGKKDLPFGYPHFDALAYSIEKFLPIGNLGMKDYWMIRNDDVKYQWVCRYGLFHQIFGWTISIVVVYALTAFTRNKSTQKE